MSDIDVCNGLMFSLSLSQMAQEVNLIPRSPDYINPFKAETIRKVYFVL